jgi:phospholipase/carboxylesterase
MNGEPDGLSRDLGFAYRVCQPQTPSGEVVILLHGSGVDETTLAPLGRSIAPRAALIAVRGRVPQDDGWRWFERITPTRFEQDDIRLQAARFAAFLGELAKAERVSPGKALFLGYSNGANLISSVMLLHPGFVRQAVLMRAMPVLDDVPATDLAGTHLLVIAGQKDETYGPYAPALVALLRDHGAAVEAHTVPLGHELGEADAAVIGDWLAAGSAASRVSSTS